MQTESDADRMWHSLRKHAPHYVKSVLCHFKTASLSVQVFRFAISAFCPLKKNCFLMYNWKLKTFYFLHLYWFWPVNPFFAILALFSCKGAALEVLMSFRVSVYLSVCPQVEMLALSSFQKVTEAYRRYQKVPECSCSYRSLHAVTIASMQLQ